MKPARIVARLGVVIGLVGTAVVLGLGSPETREAQGPVAAEAATPAVASSPSPSPSEPGGTTVPFDRPQRTRPFAWVPGLTLFQPAADPVKIAFHEATYPIALPLHPLGRCKRNDNPFKFHCPPRSDGPNYTVQFPRGRATEATSAVDVVMPASAAVLAPVDGVVFRVLPYALYGRWPDVRVEILPYGGPRLRVVLLHLTDVQVHVGSRVFAGVTPIARARLFPFVTNVDGYYEGERHAHVHIEVSRGDPSVAM